LEEAWKERDEIQCPISLLRATKLESDIDPFPVRFSTIVNDFLEELGKEADFSSEQQRHKTTELEDEKM